VDDILQEVFLAFYRNLQRIDPVENLRPYVFHIARNKCYDDLRQLERDVQISLDNEPVRLRVSFTEAHHQPKPDERKRAGGTRAFSECAAPHSRSRWPLLRCCKTLCLYN